MNYPAYLAEERPEPVAAEDASGCVDCMFREDSRCEYVLARPRELSQRCERPDWCPMRE